VLNLARIRPITWRVSSARPRPHGLTVVLPALLTAALSGAVLLGAGPASAGTFHRDRTPLPADVSGTGSKAASVATSTGSEALHMMLGLGVVLTLIFALYWLLRRTARRNDRTVGDDGFMEVVSSTPLAPSRSLHLVRVGHELVLVGSSEQSVTPIRVYGLDDAGDGGPSSRRLYDAARPGAGSLLDQLRKLTAR